jgi:hypothetical protein
MVLRRKYRPVPVANDNLQDQQWPRLLLNSKSDQPKAGVDVVKGWSPGPLQLRHQRASSKLDGEGAA